MHVANRKGTFLGDHELNPLGDRFGMVVPESPHVEFVDEVGID